MNKFMPILVTSLTLSISLGYSATILAAGTSSNDVNTKQTFSAQGKRLESQSDILLEEIKQKQTQGITDQQAQSAKVLSRVEHIAQKQQLLPKKQSRPQLDSQKTSAHYHSFAIYSAYTQLIEDIDYDGFFQTFSVTFDADVISPYANEHARVYAELYISRNGGQWEHYFTTDSFNIYGENTDDEYEVYSTLNQGFSPGEYDILIDSYEEGYSDIVATYSAEDNASLYRCLLRVQIMTSWKLQ